MRHDRRLTGANDDDMEISRVRHHEFSVMYCVVNCDDSGCSEHSYREGIRNMYEANVQSLRYRAGQGGRIYIMAG
jgi:hypothetical protein